MIVNLTQKERTLLEDQKSHEEICIKKYTNYANITSDPELKTLCQNHATTERSHLDSINQLLNGQLPNVNSQSGGGQGASSQGQGSGQVSSMESMQSEGGQSSSMGAMQGQSGHSQAGQSGSGQGASSGQFSSQISDKDLCTDLLMTEKYVSSAYNTAIFEFTQPPVRDVLNHIHKEEQQHGESIFKYMESKGLYQAK